MNVAEAAEEIAPAILPFVRLYQETTDATMKKYLSEIVEHACRKLERFCTPSVSARARDEALARISGLDLRHLRWSDQTKHDPERAHFHFEHIYPCAQMRNDVLRCRSAEEIRAIISRMHTAWILKEENESLTRNGHASNRPDPREAYRQAKVELLYPPEGW